MSETFEDFDEEFVLWNSKLGIRDFVTIGHTEFDTENSTHAWLEEPYDMVGPFCLEELHTHQEIRFAACIVMSHARWKKQQNSLRKEAFINQQKSQREFHEKLHRHNKKKGEAKVYEEQKLQECRKLLALPLEGTLEVYEIKTAYRKMVKIAHPDVGGSQEKFLAITEAKNTLLGA